jgi:predicted PurR-regulated permease PerM
VLPTIANFIATYPVNVTITLSSALVIALFLMASGDLFYEKLIRVMPRLDDKKNALRIVFDVERDVSSYLLTITAINAGLGAIVGVSFWLIGMPMPHFWAFLVFALNFIPYLGPIAGVIISGFVSIMVFSNWGQAVLAPAVYMTIIGIETQIVTPAVLSRRMSINSVAILIALAFWGWAWGIAGIIMAVPFLVTLRVFCSHLPVLNPVGEFLSGQGDNASEASANANVAKNPS